MSRANPATTHDSAGIAAWNFKLRAEIGSYEDCAEFIQKMLGEVGAVKAADLRDDHALKFTARGGEAYDYEIGPHMRVVFKHDCYAVVLYKTEIIRYYPDGTFSVDNGGFATPTTMYRLNAVLPPEYHVFHRQRKLVLRRGSEQVLWPATHDTRIHVDTGEIVS